MQWLASYRLWPITASLGLCLICWLFLLLLHPEGRTPFILTSNLLLSLLFVALYLRIAAIRSLQRILLLIAIVAATLLFTLLSEAFLVSSKNPLLMEIHYPILAPLPIILIAILISPRAALLSTPFLSLLLSTNFSTDRFFILNLATSITAAVASMRGVRTRKAIFSIAGKSLLTSLFVLYAFTLSDSVLWSPTFFADALASSIFLLITALLAVSLLPVFETLFSVLTDSALMEYMNPNNKLLQQFASDMPGTYQHSLTLSYLSEAAANAIGANSLFCKVVPLYHDIGKLAHPDFYSENQNPGLNIHTLLTPLESAQVIISHVTDGASMAKKHRLPKAFIDIILEHHGTTLVYYFYRRELENKKGNAEEIDISKFRYPGPRPRTKESALIMIADSVEAASHSIEDFTEPNIHAMVNQIVTQKAEEGQFDDCPLTFEELSRIKQSLVKSILLIHHTRVKYPSRSKCC